MTYMKAAVIGVVCGELAALFVIIATPVSALSTAYLLTVLFCAVGGWLGLALKEVLDDHD